MSTANDNESAQGGSHDVLKYQGERTLDNVPAYRVSLQLRTGVNPHPVFLGLKAHGFDVYFDPSPVLHYDPEGRLVKWVEMNRYQHRSLSHRVLETTKLAREIGGGIQRRVLSSQDADALVARAANKLAEIARPIANGDFAIDHAAPSRDEALQQILPRLQQAASFTAEAARADVQRFNSIYRPVAILPPDQYNALVLQATEGCAHNQCVFCGFYRETRFRVKTPDEFRRHAADAIAYHGASMTSRHGIFLEQANALTIPLPRLLEIFGVLNDTFKFPPPELRNSARWWFGNPLNFDGIYSFIDAFTGALKTEDDYRALRELHLRRVYLGMETGDDELLRFLNKPATSDEMLLTAQRLKAAGLSVAVIVLLGVGGEKFFDRHVERTTALISQMKLSKGDFVYLSPLVDTPGSEYFARAHEAGVEFLAQNRIDEQERAIRSAFQNIDRLCRPIIAPYDIEQFVY